MIWHQVCFKNTRNRDKSAHQLDQLNMNMIAKKTQNRTWARAVALIGLMGGSLSQVYADSIIYSQDPNLSDFTSTVASYGTFTAAASLPSSPYTPTTAILSASNYPRAIGYSSSPIYVSFSSATADILVFDNIDHLGYGWDVFQYKIYGSNTGLAGSYSLLFDPKTVNEADHPGVNVAFTLATWTGTAPTLLNDTVTPGLGSFVGNIGYEEYFTFDSSYKYFEFAPSTLTLTALGGEDETELSAVAIATPSQTIVATAGVPDGGTTLAMLGVALGGIAALRRRFARA